MKMKNGAEGRGVRQRELLEFRTPQHPALGTNNWGGASPLLARNIPKESLEQRYLRLNTTRTRDEIFPADYETYFPQQAPTPKRKVPSTPSRIFKGLVSKLKPPRREATLGSRIGILSWFCFPKWDPKHRWPNGWC